MQPDETRQSEGAGFAWTEAKRIFGEAVDQAPAERAAFVAAACGGNASLHNEVISLLENHGRGESFFEQPLASSLVPADPMIGRRIGPYQILRRVAVGGMGAVYLAERADDQFRKRVALKTVRPELFNEQALRRFQNERQTLAVLDHPNIIRLLDGGTTDEGVPYLVTEYVEGLPIDRHCTAGKLKVAERLALFRSVLGAVHYAHQNLVVHRDLKPNNILVTPEGVPKLLDFGIAKLLRPEYSAQPSGLTRPDMQAMTPDFASPEQVLGQPITTASDIYSLGVILYCLLTGHHPFERQMHTAFELSQAICETDPERPSRIAEGIELRVRGEARSLRGDLDTIVLMAMRREPRHRYASAEHFSEDIRRHLEGFPVAARQAGIWYKASKFVKRHKVSMAGAAVLIAALAVSTALAVEQYRTAARRFQDLRQFAGFVLTDLDDALREGETPARKKMAEKGLEYLDRLAKEKAGDRSIMRDLVKGYIRNGDAKGNLYGATSGDIAAGQESYRKALAIAEELVRSEPANIDDRRDLVTALLRLGEALAGAGNRTEAARQYDEAQRVLAAHQEAGTPSEPALLQTVSLWTDMGSKQALLSDPAGALQCYRRALQTAERFPPSFANKANLIAYAREQTAINAALAGSTTGAEETLRESIATYKLRKPTPRALRTLAKAYKNLATVQLMTGRAPEALASIRESLRLSEGLLAADRKNAEYQIDREQALMTEIEALGANGLGTEEKAETARGLQIMKAMADQPDATYQAAADYAELLATSAFSDLRNPGLALQYARQAATMTKETDPEVLHVLALAYEGAGDKQRALEAADKALALVPEGRPSVFSRKLQAEVTRMAR